MAKSDLKNGLKTKKYSEKKLDESVEILNVNISGSRYDQVLKAIFTKRKSLYHIATVNPEFIMEARVNSQFADILTQCNLTVADGWGVVWAARMLKGSTIDRITGGELVEEMLKKANARSEKIFLLGAASGVAAKAASLMKKKYPNVEIAWYEGAVTVKLEKNEEASMTIAKINAFEPDYLLVAYGSPWQDMWIEENRPYLRARVAVGVGGVLDEWAGIVKKCPVWLDKLGGKWIFRLVTQPWRWKRILRVIGFGGLVMYHKLID